MLGRRISKREIERLQKRMEELDELRKTLGRSEVELLTALISLDDWKRARRRLRRDRGEDDDDDDDEED